jgi:hypothetical protein
MVNCIFNTIKNEFLLRKGLDSPCDHVVLCQKLGKDGFFFFLEVIPLYRAPGCAAATPGAVVTTRAGNSTATTTASATTRGSGIRVSSTVGISLSHPEHEKTDRPKQRQIQHCSIIFRIIFNSPDLDIAYLKILHNGTPSFG